MTKEELYEMTLLPVRSKEEQDFQNAITDFLENYVCIPKGVNRHPYADVLHAMAEGIKVETRECSLLSWYTPSKIMSPLTHPSNEWRIKPSEPVYEWQWYVVSDDTKEPRLIGWNTEEEREKDTFWSSGVYRMEETKRVRQ